MGRLRWRRIARGSLDRMTAIRFILQVQSHDFCPGGHGLFLWGDWGEERRGKNLAVVIIQEEAMGVTV